MLKYVGFCFENTDMREVVAFLLEHFADFQEFPQSDDLGEMLEEALQRIEIAVAKLTPA